MRGFMRTVPLLLVGLVMTGCVAASALLYKTTGVPKIPAQYTLHKVPTLVLVENFENPDLYAVQSERVARDVTYELSENKVCPTVPPQKLADLISTNAPAFRKIDIPTIA